MAAEEFQGGEVLICGGTDWAMLGKSGGKGKKNDKEKVEEALRAEKYPNLLSPHRIGSLTGVKVRFIAAGSAACHAVFGDMEGNCYTLGRNEKGQLGTGDTVQRNAPTLVEALKGKDVIGAACGKHHTAFVTAKGQSFTCGSNLHGQCGTGSIKSRDKNEELILSPVQVALEKCTAVACGAEFTMWLCDGKLWSAGMPQYGQLGHGTDHQYNAKDSSIAIAYEPQPAPKIIAFFAGTTIVKVACGHNHTVAVDDGEKAYSWGNGGYGRLGHTVQQDEFTPRALATFSGRVSVPQHTVLACSSVASFCTITGGQMYAWGKLKASGDNTMYPKPLMEIAGWNVKSMACGASHFAVAAEYEAEKAAITWGQGQYGELGYGPAGKKSSANPDKCLALDGVSTNQVAAGVGFTLFLVDGDDPKVQELQLWDCDIEEEETAPPEKAAPAKGRGRAKAAANGKRKADDDAKPARGRGRGRGKK